MTTPTEEAEAKKYFYGSFLYFALEEKTEELDALIGDWLTDVKLIDTARAARFLAERLDLAADRYRARAKAYREAQKNER